MENSDLADKAYEKAVRFLAPRAHSEKETKMYLQKKGYSQDIIAAVLARLKEYDYVNDEAFARAFVNSYKNKYGKLYIKSRLKIAGVSRDIADLVLDYSDLDGAVVIAEKYLSVRSDVSRQKLYNYLYSRGFVSDDISSAVSAVYGGDDGETE